MAGLTGYGCTGQLTIDSVDLCCPAWDVLDLTPLWLNHAQRGAIRTLPGVPGSSPKKRRLALTEYQLPMVIIGHADRLGNAVSDPWEGLAANLAYLYDNVASPVDTGDGTRLASLTVPGELSPREGDVLVELVTSEARSGRSNRDGAAAARVRAVLRLTVPAGRLVSTGS